MCMIVGGNIVSIKDNTGNEITSNTHIGLINQYRYRGYRYDAEIGLYYLQSRYYNPQWGRFINADEFLIQSQELLGNNLYAYCMNNPINRYDPNGCFSISTLIDKVKNAINKAAQTLVNTITAPKLPNYSDELNRVMIANAKTADSIFTNSFTFYNKVNHNGDWDYKVKDIWEKDINVPFTKKFILNGRLTTPEDFGNIHYGFVGRAYGFPATVLYIGGGAAAGFNGPFSYYGDDENDHYAIKDGINLYKNYSTPLWWKRKMEF